MYPPDQSHPHAGYPGQSPAVYQGYSTVELASWGQRAGAYVIDYLMQMVIAAAVIASMVGLAFVTWEAVDPAGAGGHDPPPVFLVLILLAYPATFAALFCYRWLPHANSGQTLGKKALRIRLIKEETGDSLGKGPSAGRELIMYVISFVTCGIGNLIDLLWPLWDDKNQTLHDKVVSSVVIRK